MRNRKLIILLSIVTSLALVLIVCGATFLVRDIRVYSYYVDSPKEFDEKIVASCGIKVNSSMFALDEDKIKSNVENACCDVEINDGHYGAEVINVERIFPDKVSINYVVYDELFQYLAKNGKYYRCYANGKISREVKQAANDFNSFITVRPKKETTDEAKKYFQNSDDYDRKALKILFDFMHSVSVTDSLMPQWIRTVDLTRQDAMFNYCYVKTAAGCAIEIYGRKETFLDDLDEFLHNGWSAFITPEVQNVNQANGKIVVYTRSFDDEKEIKTVYNADYNDDDYRRDYLGEATRQG